MTVPKRNKRRKKHSWLARCWRRYEYKHTTLSIIAIVLFVFALDTALIQTTLHSITMLDRLGIFIAGLLFTSFFTTAPAIVLFLQFAHTYDPLTIALYGAAGAATGDWIILRFFEEQVGYELKPLARKLNILRYIRRLRRKDQRDRAILAGMFCIASPLPDEMGIALLGLSHLPLFSLLVITYLLNALGILAIVLAA